MIAILLSTKWGQNRPELAFGIGACLDAALAALVVALLQGDIV